MKSRTLWIKSIICCVLSVVEGLSISQAEPSSTETKPKLIVVVGTDCPSSDLRAVAVFVEDVKTHSRVDVQIITEIDFEELVPKEQKVLIVGMAKTDTLIAKWLEEDLPVDGDVIDV